MLEARAITVSGRLTDVTASLRAGEVTAICGPNGAGKSTLLACLAGLMDPDQGTALLDGAPLAAMPSAERARAMGYLPQDGAAAWNVSVRTLAGLGRLPHRTGALENDRAVEAALAAMQLGALAERTLDSLSGGEKARALLARVLAGEPQWVLADEPLASLDLGHQLALLAQFRALVDQGKGVVLVLHDLALAMNHADHVIVLDRGELIAADAPVRALSEEIIAKVWGVPGQWLGEPGRRALAL